MKKVLFINPSLRLHSETKFLPVGVACVMTYLKNIGIDFDFLDIDIEDMETIPLKHFWRIIGMTSYFQEVLLLITNG